MRRVQAKSAVVSVRTSGVLVTTTPARVAAATSILLYPTATLATTRSSGAPVNTAASWGAGDHRGADGVVDQPDEPLTSSEARDQLGLGQGVIAGVHVDVGPGFRLGYRLLGGEGGGSDRGCAGA